MITHSAAEIIRHMLVEDAIGVDNTDYPAGSWPVFVGYLPDEDTNDNAIGVYDTSPEMDGRLMAGTVIEHPGLQIRIRGVEYAAAASKLNEIKTHFETICRDVYALDSYQYRIDCIKRSSSFSLGRDEQQRSEFTLNVTATITEL